MSTKLQEETPLDSVDWLSVKISKRKQTVIIGGTSGKNYFLDSGIFKNLTSFEVNEFDLVIGQEFAATFYKKGDIFGELIEQVCQYDNKVIKFFNFKFSDSPNQLRSINKKHLSAFELIIKTSLINKDGQIHIVLSTENYEVSYSINMLSHYTGFNYAEIYLLSNDAYLFTMKNVKKFDWEGNFFIRLTKKYFKKISDREFIKVLQELIEKKLKT